MSLLTNFKIGTRMLLFFSVVIVITAIGMGIMIIETQKISEEVDNIYNVQLLSMEYLIEADRDAYQSRLALNQILFLKYSRNKNADYNSLIDDINENYNQVGQRFEKFESLSNATQQEENLKLTEQFRTNYTQLGILTEQLQLLIKQDKITLASEIYHAEYDTVFSKMRDAMDIYTGLSLKSAEVAYTASKEIKDQIILNSIILGAVILILILAGSILLSRSITVPLRETIRILTAISKGNLGMKIRRQYLGRKDEIGSMMEMLKRMNKKLHEIVETAQNSTLSIANTSDQLSSTALQLSQGAAEQASSVEEVSSTMEEISSNVEQNSDNSQETEKISYSAYDGVKEVVTLTQNAFDAQKEIAQKIQIINDIAFQTNLLALNAAVEAARAQEHGKGFAIVAGEVRKLAQRSTAAADEIISLASKSLEAAQNAGDFMNKTLPKIEKTSKLVKEISAASIEQTSGIGQVNYAIQQLNSITQQSAASSEEIASSASELSYNAKDLDNVISFFKTKNHNSTSQKKKGKKKGKKSKSEESKFELKDDTKKTEEGGIQKKEGVNFDLNKDIIISDDSHYEAF